MVSCNHINYARGNSSQRCKNFLTSVDKKHKGVGKRRWNSISHLSSLSLAGFGNRLSDGGNSQIGSFTSRDDYGYKGSFTPLIKLMKENGYLPKESAYGYIASDELAPSSIHGSDNPYQQTGVSKMLPLSKIIERRQNIISGKDYKNFIPPNQEGGASENDRKLARKEGGQTAGRWDYGINKWNANKRNKLINKKSRSIKLLSELNRNGIIVANETHDTVTFNKFGEDFDTSEINVNPIYPLAPLDPSHQQAMQPELMKGNRPAGGPKASGTVESQPNKPYTFNKHMIKTSADVEDQGKMQIKSNVDKTIDNYDLARASTQNFMWSTAHHKAALPSARTVPYPLQEGEKQEDDRLRREDWTRFNRYRNVIRNARPIRTGVNARP